jgi:hypothetical protein
MNKIIALAIAAILVATAIPGVEASNRTETTQYIPGSFVWCSEEEHSLIPTYDPPLDAEDPIDLIFDLYDWHASGEPECVYADAINVVNEASGNERQSIGLGAAAWTLLPGDLGGQLESSTDDDFFGAGSSYQWVWAESAEGEDAVAEGCGTQTIQVPEDPPRHWQSPPEDPYYLAWTMIDAVGVDDDLSICFASTGFVTATFTN